MSTFPHLTIHFASAAMLALGLVFILGCAGQDASDRPVSMTSMDDIPPTTAPEQAETFQGYIIDKDGQLQGPVPIEKVNRSDEQWRAALTPEQYRIVRTAGTERAGTGALLENKADGVYTCVACDLPLFSSDTKYKSGTGWPSFFRTIGKGNVAEHEDNTLGMRRVEVLCARCDGHLGHVFNDGPRPTGLRYCLNSASLDFTPQEELKSLAHDDAMDKAITASQTASIVIAGGCFWCVEAVFEELEGVHEAISGYAGGNAETANYKAVTTGSTGHAEAVRIIYDPNVISYEELLQVHFATHDPTQVNRQGNDHGPQYRTAIFYADEREKALAEAMIADLNESGAFSRPVATTLEPLTKFYEAERYHQNYVCDNPNQGYVRGVALPKVEKVRKEFADKLKAKSPLEQK